MRGMGLLPVRTRLHKEKVRIQVKGRLNGLEGIFLRLSGMEYSGYEIHMGQTEIIGGTGMACGEAVISSKGKNVYGTYIHGIFDKASVAAGIVVALAEKKGIRVETGIFCDYGSFKEKQYDLLADMLRENLNMEEIYGILKEARLF